MRRPGSGNADATGHTLTALNRLSSSFRTLRLPHRPATIRTPLLRAPAQLHSLDRLPPYRTVHRTNIPAGGPQVGRGSALRALIAKITARLHGAISAVRSDGSTEAGRPIVHVGEQGRNRSEVRARLAKLLG